MIDLVLQGHTYCIQSCHIGHNVRQLCGTEVCQRYREAAVCNCCILHILSWPLIRCKAMTYGADADCLHGQTAAIVTQSISYGSLRLFLMQQVRRMDSKYWGKSGWCADWGATLCRVYRFRCTAHASVDIEDGRTKTCDESAELDNLYAHHDAQVASFSAVFEEEPGRSADYSNHLIILITVTSTPTVSLFCVRREEPDSLAQSTTAGMLAVISCYCYVRYHLDT